MAAVLASLPHSHGSDTPLEIPRLSWEVSSCLCSLQPEAGNLLSSRPGHGRELFPPQLGHRRVLLKTSRLCLCQDAHTALSFMVVICLLKRTCLCLHTVVLTQNGGLNPKAFIHVLTFAPSSGGETTKFFCCR